MIAWIANLLGTVVRFIYDMVGDNYALSIILFTILTKAILFPLYLKQMKSTEQIQKIGPEDKKIREKYKNDKQKMSEELTKLYAEHKINPLGGCLPLLIQIPLIFAMFAIVKQPLTYILQTPQEQIRVYTQQILNKEDVSHNEMVEKEIEIANKHGLIDMNVLGLNLGDKPMDIINSDPSKRVNPAAIIIPILSVIISIIQTRQMQKNTTLSEEQQQMQKTTNMMLPAISGMIAITTPLALGLYWLIGGLVQVVQQHIMNNVIKKDSKKLNLKEGESK
ncbi:MAG: YidC/Oxa1 family membrane protein insertase [Clostridia bacterium]|nr:YidC/Oxa1 family membrane protein insertase [Clostridia bacterium]